MSGIRPPAVAGMFYPAESAELQRIPNDTKELSIEDSVRILKIVEQFEDDDDVQYVFHNLEVTEEAMAAMD